MSLPLLLAAILQATPAPAPSPAPQTGPLNWDALAPLPWREPPQLTPDLTRFVADEVRARRCAPPRVTGGRVAIVADVAVLVRADGQVRTTVPRAIACPTVEQFAAGLVTSFARNNLRPTSEGWYRASVTFAWGR